MFHKTSGMETDLAQSRLKRAQLQRLQTTNECTVQLKLQINQIGPNICTTKHYNKENTIKAAGKVFELPNHFILSLKSP